MTCPLCRGAGHTPIPASLLGTGYRPPECEECGGRGVVEQESGELLAPRKRPPDPATPTDVAWAQGVFADGDVLRQLREVE